MYPNFGIIVKMNQAMVMNAICQLIIQPIHPLIWEIFYELDTLQGKLPVNGQQVDGRFVHPWMCVIDCKCSTSKEPKTAWSKW